MENHNPIKLNKKMIVLAVVFASALGVLLGGISVCREIFINDTKETVIVDIPKGSGFGQIALLLEENDVIDSPLLFKVYERLKGEGVYHSGAHMFYKGMSYGQALKSLGETVSNSVTVTIPEGYELRQIGEILEKKNVCSAEDFFKAAEEEYPDYPYLAEVKNRETPLEGYLFPDTYNFEIGQAPRDVINVMLDNFSNKAYKEYLKSNTEKTLDEIIIMASIIEREAANDNERGKVSSVFYNRLKIGMLLQSCATVQYIIKERKDVLSNKDIKIDSPYNTYMYEGLPIGPIASPGLGSIKAAIFPEETEYFYFAATKDGERNVFSKTGEEHLKTVKELQG